MKIQISEPVMIAMGPKSREAGWGPYQFASLFRREDGRLICLFQLLQDSELDYGQDNAAYVSDDNGKTWKAGMASQMPQDIGTRLPNGDILHWVEYPAIPADDPSVTVRAEGDFIGHIERKSQFFYDYEDISCPTLNRNWVTRRFVPGQSEPIVEETEMNWGRRVHRVARGVLVRPYPFIKHFRVGPDGSLWATHHEMGCDPVTGRFRRWGSNYLFRSTDNGHTWDLMHYLPYEGEKYRENDPLVDQREGFGENDICWAPDGTAFRIIRTHGFYPRTEHCHYHHSYIIHSPDGGFTWEEPQIFDDRGVMPVAISLKCGVTLATYGRPGCFIRASFDPSARVWEDRIEIVHSDGTPNDSESCVDVLATCGYSDLVEIDDHTAGFAYSDFTQKDENGEMRKCIMFRTITVVED